jgi:phosphoglycerate dehydrogenase-like enzyme
MTTQEKPISEKKVVIACDLFLKQKLYLLPSWLSDKISMLFPNVEIQPINVPGISIQDSDAEIYWGNRITPEVVSCLPKLKWIHFGSVGTNRLHDYNINTNDLWVTSSKGTVISSMVTSATAFMTGLARGVHRAEVLRQKGKMNREYFDQYFSEIQECNGQNCLIVGYGDVGKKLADVCFALGMNVSIVQKPNKKNIHKFDAVFSLNELSSAVSTADYVVNLLPYNAETKFVFNHSIFKSMQKNSFFINIGRGETVDELSLIKALNEGWIAGAGLDVFSNEPLTTKSPLWSMDNVMLTPHVAGLSSEYWRRQSDIFIHNLSCWLDDSKADMKNIVSMAD